ncbi:MoxR protein [Bosea sp. Root381]|nr:MoxR protein [Bosea sp. Root381]
MRDNLVSDGHHPIKTARAFVTLEDLLRLEHRASGFSFLPRQPVHSLLAGRHASRLRGRGLNFEELRHYFEGDDTRTIDWLATARLGSPHVRVYSEERDRPVILLIDQRSTMFFGSRRAMKSVAAAEAAALAAWRVSSLGDRVGAVVFTDDGIVSIKAQARDKGVVRVLSEIAKANAALAAPPTSSGDERLNEALAAACRMVAHDGLVCLISDAAGEDDETQRLITKLSAHNDVLAIFIHDPLEQDLPDIGRATFSSGVAEIEVDASAPDFRLHFGEERRQWRERLAGLSRKRAIPVLPISTDRDVADQYRELIGRRQAQRLASGRRS